MPSLSAINLPGFVRVFDIGYATNQVNIVFKKFLQLTLHNIIFIKDFFLLCGL